ncbi:hypothetical protein R9C00_15910 [Flammeovirgaceae bacterium SG7u.111]|nr:hypothetical protein [Flammeovirgaceae bacterium SG7u.132]WPO33188.1 hypothetical protein R9C00_15910 [Flammeovirgaceae bacterium SG7u.111]
MIIYNLSPELPSKNFAVDFHLRAAQKAEEFEKSKQELLAEATPKLRELLELSEGFEVKIVASEKALLSRLDEIFKNGLVKLENPRHNWRNNSPYISNTTKAIYIEQTNLQTGFHLPVSELEAMKIDHPHSLFLVNATHSLPFAEPCADYADLLFFRLDLGFGMTGKAILCIMNQEIAKLLGSMDDDLASEEDIFLTGKISEDYVMRGAKALKGDIKYKSVLMYQLFSSKPEFTPLVGDKKYRSDMVIGATVPASMEINKLLESIGIQIAYSEIDEDLHKILIANSPNYSKEVFEKLVDFFDDQTSYFLENH